MWWWHGDWGWGAWLVMSLGMLAFWVLVIWLPMSHDPGPVAWPVTSRLHPVPGAKPARVSTASLARVLPAVESLRELGQDRELLRALVDSLEDQRIRSHPRVRKSLEQVHRGEYEFYSSEDL